jgi:hypothetical protein
MPSLNEARLVVFSRLQGDLRKMDTGIEMMHELQKFEEEQQQEPPDPDDAASGAAASSETALQQLHKLLDESCRAQARAKMRLDEVCNYVCLSVTTDAFIFLLLGFIGLQGID